MENNLISFRKSKIIYRLVSKDSFAIYNIFCWTFGLMINLFTAFWLVRGGGDEDRPRLVAKSSTEKLWLRIMSFFHSAISMLFLICWFIYSYKQRRLIAREDFIFDNPGVDPNSPLSMFKINVFKSILVVVTPVNMSLHILFSILGSFYTYFLLTLNLILVVNISRTCKFVIKAITLHADQLITTLVMAFFIIYSYTIIIADNFYESLNLDEPNPNMCGSLLECFIYTMNLGLRNGGGIAESMKVEPPGPNFFGRNMFDLSFFMIINVIALNIIFGIIIDTFSQLRDD